MSVEPLPRHARPDPGTRWPIEVAAVHAVILMPGAPLAMVRVDIDHVNAERPFTTLEDAPSLTAEALRAADPAQVQRTTLWMPSTFAMRTAELLERRRLMAETEALAQRGRNN